MQLSNNRIASVAFTIIAASLAIGSPSHAQVVKASGTSISGALGNGSGLQQLYPLETLDLNGVPVDVEAGGSFSLVLMADGTVRSFGSNFTGQLGVGLSPSESASPLVVPGLNNITAISAGAFHALALRNDGKVFAWGSNQYGECAQLPTTTKFYTPTLVPGLSNITAIAAGGSHSVALRADGTVWCFGYGYFGQLGNGVDVSSHTPVMASGINSAVEVAAGGYHTIARLSNGSLRGWGNNGSGQLGSGVGFWTAFPSSVVGVTEAVDIECGNAHTMVVRFNTKQLFAFGDNTAGQLGIGNTTSTSTPTSVGLTNIVNIDSSGSASAAVDSQGGIHTWGANNYGQLGSGTLVSRTQPAPAAKILNATCVSINSHLLVIANDQQTPAPPTCTGDIAPGQGDGMVSVQDLLTLISAWGACN